MGKKRRKRLHRKKQKHGGHRQTECRNKEAYTSPNQAQDEANRLADKLGKPMTVYRCSWCYFYHVGGLGKRR